MTMVSSSNKVFASGSIVSLGSVRIRSNLIVFDGVQWKSLGGIASGFIRAISFSQGQIVLGGRFRVEDNVQCQSFCDNLSGHDEIAHNPLVTSSVLDGAVSAVAADGLGIFVGGEFVVGNSMSNLALLSSRSWFPVLAWNSAIVNTISNGDNGCLYVGTASGVVTVCGGGTHFAAVGSVVPDLNTQQIVLL